MKTVNMVPGKVKSSNLKNKGRIYGALKRVCDIVLSLPVIIILSPLFIIFSLLIFFTDHHSPIYKQTRIGIGGKAFKIWKFRSMYYDAGDLGKYFSGEQLEQFKTEYKLENDPRITPIGKFIRKFSIDELPQLFNVLAGQMSLIGPRPLTLEETYFFGDDRDLLLSVRPGMTGLWQVSGRNALTYESGKRQECELTYVKNVGFAMDIKVFFKTFGVIFGGKGL